MSPLPSSFLALDSKYVLEGVTGKVMMWRRETGGVGKKLRRYLGGQPPPPTLQCMSYQHWKNRGEIRWEQAMVFVNDTNSYLQKNNMNPFMLGN